MKLSRLKNRSGQAMLEYILVFGALSIIVLVLLNFVDAARQSAQKTAELVTSDYP